MKHFFKSFINYLLNLLQLTIEVWGTLSRNKLRTTLTGVSVSMGIFLLIFLIGSSNGVLNAFQHNMGAVSLDLINIFPGRTAFSYHGYKEGRIIELTQKDLTRREKTKPYVKLAIASLTQSGVNIRNADCLINGTLYGVYPAYKDLEQVKIKYGRFLNDNDIRECRKVAVISEEDAKELFNKSSVAVGKEFGIGDLLYQVVGVKESKASMGGMSSGDIYIPFTTLKYIYNKGENIADMSLKTIGLNTDQTNEEFEQNIRQELARTHDFSPKDENAVRIRNMGSRAKQANEGISILKKAIWIIGLLTLISGIVGISNITLISVKERTKEIGIRKAIGAKPYMILTEVILESIITTFIFGYFGLCVGVIGTELLNTTAKEQSIVIAGNEFLVFLDSTVDLNTALTALLVLIIAGIIAGTIPALKAVRTKPIEALKG